jgi:hypothetical protein
LRGLLNAGHQRNRPAIRWDAGTRSLETIPTFAMAALAGIGAMPDTIEDRAVVIKMRRLAFGDSTPAPGKEWTNTGDVHEDRGLKGRSHKSVRKLTIPPELLCLIRAHIEQFGTAPDGSLFRSEQGNPLSVSRLPGGRSGAKSGLGSAVNRVPGLRSGLNMQVSGV